jgi:hypothetical protein
MQGHVRCADEARGSVPVWRGRGTSNALFARGKLKLRTATKPGYRAGVAEIAHANNSSKNRRATTLLLRKEKYLRKLLAAACRDLVQAVDSAGLPAGSGPAEELVLGLLEHLRLAALASFTPLQESPATRKLLDIAAMKLELDRTNVARSAGTLQQRVLCAHTGGAAAGAAYFTDLDDDQLSARHANYSGKLARAITRLTASEAPDAVSAAAAGGNSAVAAAATVHAMRAIADKVFRDAAALLASTLTDRAMSLDRRMASGAAADGAALLSGKLKRCAKQTEDCLATMRAVQSLCTVRYSSFTVPAADTQPDAILQALLAMELPGTVTQPQQALVQAWIRVQQLQRSIADVEADRAALEAWREQQLQVHRAQLETLQGHRPPHTILSLPALAPALKACVHWLRDHLAGWLQTDCMPAAACDGLAVADPANHLLCLQTALAAAEADPAGEAAQALVWTVGAWAQVSAVREGICAAARARISPDFWAVRDQQLLLQALLLRGWLQCANMQMVYSSQAFWQDGIITGVVSGADAATQRRPSHKGGLGAPPGAAAAVEIDESNDVEDFGSADEEGETEIDDSSAEEEDDVRFIDGEQDSAEEEGRAEESERGEGSTEVL